MTEMSKTLACVFLWQRSKQVYAGFPQAFNVPNCSIFKA